MSRLQETNQNLSVIANSLETANEALKDIVRQGNEEEVRTRQFEEKYTKMRAVFLQYEEEAKKQDRQASELKYKLEQEILKSRGIVECLKSEIGGLDEQIREQDIENERLDRELRDKVKQYKLNLDDHNCTLNNASPIVPSQNSIAQRLLYQDSNKSQERLRLLALSVHGPPRSST